MHLLSRLPKPVRAIIWRKFKRLFNP